MELTIDKPGWKKVKFGEVCRQVNDTARNPQVEGLLHVVGLEHIGSNDLHIRSWNTLERETTFTRKFVKGQVLFGRRRAYQAKVAYAEFDGICSGDILVFEAIKCKLLPELLPFIVQSQKFFNKAVETSAGSLSPRTKFKDLAELEILLPPKDEQARLAELLWAADNVVESEMEEKEKLLICRQSLLKKLFSIKKESFISLYKLPIHEINGLWRTEEDVETINVKVIRSTEFSDFGKICFDKLEIMPVKLTQYKSRKLFPGDIVVERSGGGPDQPVGRVCFFEESEGEYSFSNFTSCIRLKNIKTILPKYLFHFLQFFWELMGTDRMQNQTTGIRNLDYELYKHIKVPISNIEIQKDSVKHIDEILSCIDNQISQIKISGKLKRRLINEVF